MSPESVITMHLSKIVQDNIIELLSYTETQKLLDEISIEHPKLVRDIIPERVDVSTLQKILHSLLKENIPIKDLPTILEAMTNITKEDTSLMELTSLVRVNLSRQICSLVADENNKINAITLSEDWNKTFFAAFSKEKQFQHFALAPSDIELLVTQIRQLFQKHIELDLTIVTIPELRPHLKKVLNSFYPHMNILSHKEIHPSFKIQHIGMIEKG